MEIEGNFPKLTEFKLDDIHQLINFKATSSVTTGVECDVYTFVEDLSKDLGIIRITAGHTTPLQRVLQGDSTLEGYLSGKGKLMVTRADGLAEVYEFGTNPHSEIPIELRVGDVMQWQAASDSSLTAFEICYPPYQDGRYEDIV